MVWWGEGAPLPSYVRQLWTTLHVCPGSICQAEPRWCHVPQHAQSVLHLHHNHIAGGHHGVAVVQRQGHGARDERAAIDEHLPTREEGASRGALGWQTNGGVPNSKYRRDTVAEHKRQRARVLTMTGRDPLPTAVAGVYTAQ